MQHTRRIKHPNPELKFMTLVDSTEIQNLCVAISTSAAMTKIVEDARCLGGDLPHIGRDTCELQSSHLEQR